MRLPRWQKSAHNDKMWLVFLKLSGGSTLWQSKNLSFFVIEEASALLSLREA